MITYKKMSLFEAPEHSILVHGCNAQGVWGSGIAVPFKQNFPLSFKEYNVFCEAGLITSRRGQIGKGLITCQENKRFVGCLITSSNYGTKKDSPEDIIAQTYLALHDFCENYVDLGFQYTDVYSNKFNSGLFNVPWEATERVLKYFTKRYGINWVVCDPNHVA